MRFDPSTRNVALMVLRHGPISRADIARRLGMSSGSLTRITKPLLEEGVVEQGEPAHAQVGRPSLPLRMVDGAARFLGVKIVPGAAYLVSCGLAVRPYDRWQIELDTSTPEKAAVGLARQVERAGPVGAVGIVLPAAVDVWGGLYATRMLGWQSGSNVSHQLELLTGVRTATANDSDGLTLYHHWFGAGRGTEHFCLLTFGAGIGVGAVVDDQLLFGHQGAASVLGRLWTRDGRLFGDVLSQPAIARAASAVTGRNLDFWEALRDEDAQPVLDDARRCLGELARAAAVAYAPSRILVTGEGIPLLGDDLRVVREELERDWREDLAVPELVVEPLDFFDFARGAAAHAIRLTLDG